MSIGKLPPPVMFTPQPPRAAAQKAAATFVPTPPPVKPVLYGAGKVADMIKVIGNREFAGSTRSKTPALALRCAEKVGALHGRQPDRIASPSPQTRADVPVVATSPKGVAALAKRFGGVVNRQPQCAANLPPAPRTVTAATTPSASSVVLKPALPPRPSAASIAAARAKLAAQRLPAASTLNPALTSAPVKQDAFAPDAATTSRKPAVAKDTGKPLRELRKPQKLTSQPQGALLKTRLLHSSASRSRINKAHTPVSSQPLELPGRRREMHWNAPELQSTTLPTLAQSWKRNEAIQSDDGYVTDPENLNTPVQETLTSGGDALSTMTEQPPEAVKNMRRALAFYQEELQAFEELPDAEKEADGSASSLDIRRAMERSEGLTFDEMLARRSETPKKVEHRPGEVVKPAGMEGVLKALLDVSQRKPLKHVEAGSSKADRTGMNGAVVRGLANMLKTHADKDGQLTFSSTLVTNADVESTDGWDD